MATVPKKLLEYLIRECVSEILRESDETNGAPAPPADGLGTADTPAIPKRDNAFELKELVRHIVSGALNELMPSSFNSLSDEQQQAMITDPKTPPVDSMTPFEKAQLEREQEKQRRDSVKKGEEELKVAKKETDFQKQKLDQNKRMIIPSLQKKLQQLKGGRG